MDRADKVGMEKKRKEKKKKRKRRVLWIFYPFGLLGETVLPNGPQNCSSSQCESAPQIKQQLELFWPEPELY
jgi:hypothetical protein